MRGGFQLVVGVAGVLLALNFRDSAYRFYELILNRGPFGPGPGFSPVVLRLVGAVLGVVMISSGMAGLVV